MDEARGHQLAADLHAGPIQELTISRMRIELMRARIEQLPELLPEFEELERSVASACDGLRKLVAALDGR